MKRSITFFCTLFISLTYSAAQPITKEDYARAVSFLWENLNNKKAYNLSMVPNWHADSTGFWFTHYAAGEKRYDNILFKPLERKPLFDQVKLANQLGEQKHVPGG